MQAFPGFRKNSGHRQSATIRAPRSTVIESAPPASPHAFAGHAAIEPQNFENAAVVPAELNRKNRN